MLWHPKCRALMLLLVFVLCPMSTFAESEIDLEKGVQLFEAKEYVKAKEIFTAIVKDSKNAEALYYLGRLCFTDRDYEKAIKWFKKAIKLKPDLAEAHAKAPADVEGVDAIRCQA